MAIENINDYAGMWANGVNIGQLWDKIKEKFVSGAHVQSDATTYPASWKQQARANIGLTIGANKMWYGSAANTIGEVTTSTFGRGLLNTSSGTEIMGLFAETAEKDKNGIEISENYAHSLAISDGYLRLKNNRYVSGTASAQDLSALQLNVKLGLLQLDNTGSAGKIPLVHIPDSIMGQLTYGGTITAYTQSTDSLTVSITTGAKAILEQKTGRTIGNKTVKLVATASDPSDTSSIAYFNYTDCTGIYFIWTADALETHTGEPDYRVWPSSGPRYQAGDWLISNDTKWDKVDNTDAVTGVKGSNESAFRLGNVSIDALDVRALATYLTNTTQTVADKVQFNKDIWSLGGVAAYGISDLSAGGGGGGGLSGTIIRNWSNYQGAETEVLGANLGMRGFRMSGYSFQVNKPAVNTDNWQTEFTLGTENIPDLPLTQITGTDDLQAIEALTATSGFLKKTAANTWSLATDVVTTAGQQALTNKTYNGLTLTAQTTGFTISGGTTSKTLTVSESYTLGAACAKGVDTSITASSTSANLPTSAAVAGLVSGYLPLTGGTLTGSYLPLVIKNSTQDSVGLRFAGVSGNLGGIAMVEANGSLFRIDGAWNNQYKIWDAGNDGSGSGLDADKLDGYEASGLFESLTNDSDQLKIQIGNTSKLLTLDYAKKTSRMRTEIKADQEFVYRQSPQTIDADSLVINKFKGRTVAWNQLVDFTNSTRSSGATFADVTANGATITSSSTGDKGFTKSNAYVSGHKVYVRANCKASASGVVAAIQCGSWGSYISKTSTDTNWFSLSGILNTVATSLFFCLANSTSGQSLQFKDCICIDLTLFYGGNVPEGLTVADFERDYGEYLNSLTPNAGELRNNDAKQFESVGLNIWDEEWELGYYSDTNGTPVSATTSIRSKSTNYIPIVPSTTYYFKTPQNGGICYYDINKNFLSYASFSSNHEFTTPSGAVYARFGLSGSYGTTYNHDICINISDSAKNGTYVPYEEPKVTDLNFDAIQVKSHNIWDEEWESGAYDTDGNKTVSNMYIRNKNSIPCEPNTTYYFYDSLGNKNQTAFFFSSSGTFLGYTSASIYNSTFTTPVNCHQLCFCRSTSSLTGDICINVSSSFNGQYEPHGILTINGLKQAGSVYDEIVGNKLVKRIGSVDMGTLDWTLAGTVFQSGLADKKIISGGWRVGGVCARYLISPSSNSRETPDKCFSYGWESTLLFVNDTSYSTAAAFKTAMNGVYLNYELATPIEYELASPIPDTMPAGTTERIISDRLPVTPFACDMTYGANPKDILASAVPFSRLQGVRLERGAFTMSTQNDSNWYLVTLGDKKLYLRFTVNTGAFKLEMASDDTENPEYSKSFEFATLSTADINAICV